MASIRKLVNGSEVSHRRFVWCGNEICEERDAAGAVTKRFFPQGMKVETGPVTGALFYTRDHLGSVRELTDSVAAIQVRHDYDLYGQTTKVVGSADTAFGFAGYFRHSAGLQLTLHRIYDPSIARWLTRIT
jgi:hypothetical protein